MAMFADIRAFLGLINVVGDLLVKNAEKAAEDKENYAAKLELASGDNLFKYLLLINVSALEGYVAQTRLQAQQSFRLTRWIAVLGFCLIGAGVGLGIYLNAMGKPALEATYLAAVAGVLTEFISGVFFYLYNRTLQQINRFHDKLVYMQQLSMSYLSTSLIADATKRDAARIDISKSSLLAAPSSTEPAQLGAPGDAPRAARP